MTSPNEAAAVEAVTDAMVERGCVAAYAACDMGQFPQDAVIPDGDRRFVRAAIAAYTAALAGAQGEAHTMINHEREPHCIGCYVIHWNNGDPRAICNECGHRVELLDCLIHHAGAQPAGADVEALAWMPITDTHPPVGRLDPWLISDEKGDFLALARRSSMGWRVDGAGDYKLSFMPAQYREPPVPTGPPKQRSAQPDTGTVERGDMQDAYEGAREDLLDWKGRAQRAERTLRGLGYTGIEANEPPTPAGATVEGRDIVDAVDDPDGTCPTCHQYLRTDGDASAVAQAAQCDHQWATDGFNPTACVRCGIQAAQSAEASEKKT